ncbi:MAG: sporulation peptidase YabG [Bacillota bacterium]|jgi:spore coat assembly protein
MKKIKIGDIVGRKSYGCDVLFKINDIYEHKGETRAKLKGLDVRLIADAPMEDLELQSPDTIFQFRLKMIEKNNQCMHKILMNREIMRKTKNFRGKEVLEDESNDHHGDFFEVPGRVLHLDGDKDYLEKCMRSYIQMEVPARGFHVPEKEQPQAIEKILAEYTADILVLTGHDGFVKGTQDFSRVDNYHNSKYFAEAVRTARKLDPSRNGLVIFAGACQSHYESLLEAGANFASSPQRVLIHAFDPVFLVEKIAYTSFTELVSLKDIIENTITGEDGIGGIETHGRFRMGYPKSPY